MNFGKWIIVAFILFALFMGTLVTVCVQQDISLVSKDYYKEELVYQEQIRRISNAQNLKIKPKVGKTNELRLEVSFADKIDKGELKLFCPSNQRMDRIFVFNSSAQSQSFKIDDLQSGMYRAKIFWSMDGKEYYYEEVIYI
ncbi:MAG: FixH family protein [Bacteroidota bacterium]